MRDLKNENEKVEENIYQFIEIKPSHKSQFNFS